ncbi:MAG: peptidyl-prolyl cis-trans isomerase [Tumebacillaceae bacterium]
MKKRNWIAGAIVLTAVIGGTQLWVNFNYNPLLFAVGSKVVRTSDWEPLKAKLFNGVYYSAADERDKLQQRSFEELTLAKGSEMHIQADEAQIDKLLNQVAPTTQERAKKFAEQNTTEQEVRENYRRALIGFNVKAQVTQDVTVTEQEITDYYNQNKASFYAPEYRSLYYLKARADDTLTASLISTASADNFQKIAEKYVVEQDGRSGGFHELIGIDHLISHMTQKTAEAAFQAPAHKIIGPMQDGTSNYWVLVTDIRAPRQFTLMEVQSKVSEALLQDKQVQVYRKWLDEQKPGEGYYYDADNLMRGKIAAFWHDLQENLHLLFHYK